MDLLGIRCSALFSGNRASAGTPPMVDGTEGKWRDFLRELTSGLSDEPLMLIVKDASEPALLDPSVNHLKLRKCSCSHF
jgi:hypothetical protein